MPKQKQKQQQQSSNARAIRATAPGALTYTVTLEARRSRLLQALAYHEDTFVGDYLATIIEAHLDQITQPSRLLLASR